MNKFEFKKLTPFKWFVLENFPFIEADFDALTEWQLFCKLGKEMNKIINSENILGSQIENVTNAFIELQNYVNNYFDNLDIQEEVNKKLNEMSEDGTLQSIIDEYLEYNTFRTFNTMTDLINANVINNQNVCVLGNKEINDGGKAFYKIIEYENLNIDNYFYILLNNGLVAKLIFTNKFELNPMLYNNTTDISRLQSTINLACDLINNNNTKITILLNKNFNLNNTTLYINKEVKREKLTFKGGSLTKTDEGYMFTKNNTTPYITDIDFDNVMFIGSETSTNTKIISSPDFINILFNNCEFRNINTICNSNTYIQAVNVVNSLITGGRGNLFEAPSFYGLHILNNTIEHRTNSIVINQLITDQLYDTCYDLIVNNNIIEGFEVSSCVANLRKIDIASFDGNYFEALHDFIVINSSNGIGSVNITNNRCHQNSNYPMDTTGLLKLIDNNGRYNIPKINMCNNKVNNLYAIFYNNEISSFTNQILFNNNSVNNSFTTDEYIINEDNINPPFNILPVIKTLNTNPYNRTVIINSNDIIKKEFVLNDRTIVFFIHNNVITVSSAFNITFQDNQDINFDVYLGFDLMGDDIFSIQVYTQTVSIKNYCRLGNANQKYLNITANGTTGSHTIYISALLVGNRG